MSGQHRGGIGVCSGKQMGARRALRYALMCATALTVSLGSALAGEVVVINGPGAFNQAAYGNSSVFPYDTPNVAASGNSLTIQNGAIVAFGARGGDAAGNLPTGQHASNNTVTISNATINANPVYGGFAGGNFGNANANSVTINGGSSIASHVYGGYSVLNGTGDNNVVTISGSSVGGSVFGSAANTGNAANNVVTVSGSTIAGSIHGGQSAFRNAIGNSVTINGGNVGSYVVGGNVMVSGNASNNSVTINGGSVGGVYGGVTSTGSATNNTVEVSGGSTISGDIYGSYTSNGAATGNTVTLGAVTFVGGAGLYGASSLSGDAFTGNTLNLKAAGVTVGRLENFQFLNFYLPTAFAAGGTMLTVTGTANLTNGSGTASTVNVGINGASSPLKTGDTVTLIHAGTLTATGVNTTANGTGMQGVTLKYNFSLATTPTDLTATVTSTGTTEGSKALSEGFLAGMTLVNQGSDLAAGKGIANAIMATGGAMGLTGFGAMSGGSSRYDTGSHINLDSLALMMGLAKSGDVGAARLTGGAFFEYGNGNYDTYNAFSSGPVYGGGNGHYLGGGVLGHAKWAGPGPGQFYAETVLRAGQATNGFSSADLVSGGVAASYDTTSAYYGVQTGLGYVLPLAPATTVDLYGKYFWTRLEGDSARLSTGETVDFDAVTSSRTRLGARFGYAFTPQVTSYVGGAWEHEFDGLARASVAGLPIEAPSLKGNTSIVELGVLMRPSERLPLFVDVSLQGFFGEREGFLGNVRSGFTF
jgi:hypothetical protein